MLKKLLITTAASGLMLSAALAQSSMSPSGSSTSPGASEYGSGSSDAMKSDASKSTTTSSSASSGASAANIVSKQRQDEWLASKFKGIDVVGADNQKIGDVSDILFSKDGKIDAYIISVGGFLGVGSKEVAVAPTAFQVIAGDDKNEDKLKLGLSKDQLAQAPEFEEYKSARATTGASSSNSSGSMAPRPNPAGSPPANNAPAR